MVISLCPLTTQATCFPRFDLCICQLCAAIDIHYSNDLAGVWARLQEVFQVDQL